MSQPVVTVGPETSLAEVARTMVDYRIGGVPVVDPPGKLRGIVTETDFAAKERGMPFSILLLSQVFSEPVPGEAIERLHRELADQGLAILAIDLREPRAQASSWAASMASPSRFSWTRAPAWRRRTACERPRPLCSWIAGDRSSVAPWVPGNRTPRGRALVQALLAVPNQAVTTPRCRATRTPSAPGLRRQP